MGCFALTELAYGNNAVEMETTAHYDKETKEFIINTPSTKAQKYWITNGRSNIYSVLIFMEKISFLTFVMSIFEKSLRNQEIPTLKKFILYASL